MGQAIGPFKAADRRLLLEYRLPPLARPSGSYMQPRHPLPDSSHAWGQENDILRSWSSMLGTLRECNACLRWLCCHALPPAASAGSVPLGTGRHKAAAAAQGAAPPIDKLLRLLLDTAVLEHQVPAHLSALLMLKLWQCTC